MIKLKSRNLKKKQAKFLEQLKNSSTILYKSQEFYEKIQQSAIYEEDYPIIFQKYYISYNYDPEQMVKSSEQSKYFFITIFFYKEIFFFLVNINYFLKSIYNFRDKANFTNDIGVYSLNVRRIPNIVRLYKK